VTPDGGDVGRLLFSAVLIGALVAGAASAVVVGSHYDQSDYERGARHQRPDQETRPMSQPHLAASGPRIA